MYDIKFNKKILGQETSLRYHYLNWFQLNDVDPTVMTVKRLS